MKKYFRVTTSTVVASGLGAAIFTLLFMFVKIPSPVPQTSFQTAYGFAGFIAALYGPIAGALSSFIGHAISDALQYGSPWWSWVISSGLAGFIFGFSYKKIRIEEGEFKGKDIFIFNLFQIIGNAIAWLVIAPVLDIIIYAEPAGKVFVQGIAASFMNMISTGVIGTALLIVYAATKPKKGSLKKQE
ncbi:MAG: ECF-type riboflavin transporter substrate-binding protein [Fervidobacterium sp.]|nr:ECF-type riboflavin transporter substrate-binding protein [Fervidobacterium sp.]